MKKCCAIFGPQEAIANARFRLTVENNILGRVGLFRRGFSLVQLLVVIGIIGLLLAMLLPAVRIVREIGQRAQCQSNLRQIGLAMNQYANENRGSMPNWSGWHSTAFPANAGDEVSWTGKLSSILSPDSPVYNCPSFPSDFGKLHNYFICAVWAGTNGRHATKFSDVKLGGRFILSGDMTQLALYPPPLGSSPDGDDYDRDDFGMNCLCFPADGGFLMHRGGNNVLFDDCHVELFAGFDPGRMTFHPTRMLTWTATQEAGADSSAKSNSQATEQ